jgi:hypothetical protein
MKRLLAMLLTAVFILTSSTSVLTACSTAASESDPEPVITRPVVSGQCITVPEVAKKASIDLTIDDTYRLQESLVDFREHLMTSTYKWISRDQKRLDLEVYKIAGEDLILTFTGVGDGTVQIDLGQSLTQVQPSVYQSRDLTVQVLSCISYNQGPYSTYNLAPEPAIKCTAAGSRLVVEGRTSGRTNSAVILVTGRSDAVYVQERLEEAMLGNYIFARDGILQKEPSNYVPYQPNNWYLTASSWSLNQVLDLLVDYRPVRDLSLYYAYKFAERYNEMGFIPTAPRSQWLYEDFNIGYEFYDTRMNTNTVRFLMKINNYYPDRRFQEPIHRYFDFYKDFASRYRILTKSGYLPCDYMDQQGQGRITHVSLNHAITEMSALYDYYLLCGDEEALNMARSIRGAVEDMHKRFVKPDGDLWYGMTPDYTFVLQDYRELTLNDLIEAQGIIRQVEGEENPALQYLIDAKQGWLERNPKKEAK